MLPVDVRAADHLRLHYAKEKRLASWLAKADVLAVSDVMMP